MTITVDIHEAKTHLSRLLERVAAGEDVVISKAGTPVADLIPHRSTQVAFGGRFRRCCFSTARSCWGSSTTTHGLESARKPITSTGRVFVSAASVWELTIKAMLGKLAVPPQFSTRLADQGLSLLSVTVEQLTADHVLLGLGHDFIIDATR